MKKLTFLVSIIISAIFLYLSFSNFNLHETLSYVKRTDIGMLLLASLIFIISFILRGIRWKIILAKSGTVSARIAIANIFVGQMGNNILPWRMGDLWRLFLLKKQENVSMASSGAGLGIERLYDGITIIILGIISSSIYSVYAKMLRALYYLAGAVALIVILVVAFFKIFKNKEGKLIKNIMLGISTMKDPRTFLSLIAFSLIIWCIESLSFYFFYLSSGFRLTILQIFFVVFALNIALLIPAAPASLGTFEYAIVFSSKLFHISKSAAVSLAVTIHFMRFLSINLVALFLMLELGMKVKEEIIELEEAAQLQDESSG